MYFSSAYSALGMVESTCSHDCRWHSLEECNADASNNRAAYGNVRRRRLVLRWQLAPPMRPALVGCLDPEVGAGELRRQPQLPTGALVLADREDIVKAPVQTGLHVTVGWRG